MSAKGRFGGREEEEEDEGANWIDSYSDLVTDLMAIFVVLFSFAMMNQAIVTYNIAHPDETAAGAPPAYEAAFVPEVVEKEAEAAEDDTNLTLGELEESLTAYIDEAALSDYLSIIHQGENKVLLRVSASVLFNSAQASITSEAKSILDRVSGVLEMYRDSIEMITVEGHADTRPVHSREFPSNWELSSVRAVNVVKYILGVSEIRPEQFSAVSYGEFQPVADNDTEEGMAQNRRVDFIIKLRQGG